MKDDFNIFSYNERSDHVWSSTDMSEQVMARLRRKQFPYAYKHIAYESAGHAIGRPYTSTMDLNDMRHPLTGRVMHFGGTPEGKARAREDSWRQTLAFLDEQLRHLQGGGSPRALPQ